MIREPSTPACAGSLRCGSRELIITSRAATGINALHVIMSGSDRTGTAMITREALEECWDIGPEQDDLLLAFAGHKDEIAAAVRHLSKTAPGDSVLIKDLAVAIADARKSQRTPRPIKLGE